MIISIGIDVVDISRLEERLSKESTRFRDRVFTPLEIAYCEGRPSKFASYAARFAAKEAALKALHLGLTVDTRAVNCGLQMPLNQDWAPFTVECDGERIANGAELQGWWRIVCLDGEGFVLTLVTQGQSQHSGVQDDERYGVLH